MDWHYGGWPSTGARNILCPNACQVRPGCQSGWLQRRTRADAPALFQGCVYLAGVAAEVHAQMQFPSTALYWGVSASANMEFRPADATITWRQAELNVNEYQGSGLRNMARAEPDDPRAIKKSLLAYMESEGQFALSRYRRPEPGLDPGFVFKMRLVVDIRNR
jgi:hypothetical protein